MALFVSGYLAVLDMVNAGLKEVMLKHLRQLMSDTATYGLEPVCTYHTVSLQQMENGRAEWQDTICKLEFYRALIWNTIQRGNARPHPPAAP